VGQLNYICAEALSYKSTGTQQPDLILSIGEYGVFQPEEKGPYTNTSGDPCK